MNYERDNLNDDIEIIEEKEVYEDNVFNKNETIKSVDNVEESFKKDKSFKKKIIIFSGTIFFILLIFLLMYYFFYKKVDLQMNISTDKKFEFVYFDGEKTQFTTQKFISELGYSMRYDIENFEVFQYKSQDVYKCITNSDVVISIEKSKLPNICNNNLVANGFSYNNCEVLINEDMKEYYFYNDSNKYKITINLPENIKIKNDNNYEDIIDKMLTTFEINDKEQK